MSAFPAHLLEASGTTVYVTVSIGKNELELILAKNIIYRNILKDDIADVSTNDHGMMQIWLKTSEIINIQSFMAKIIARVIRASVLHGQDPKWQNFTFEVLVKREQLHKYKIHINSSGFVLHGDGPGHEIRYASIRSYFFAERKVVIKYDAGGFAHIAEFTLEHSMHMHFIRHLLDTRAGQVSDTFKRDIVLPMREGYSRESGLIDTVTHGTKRTVVAPKRSGQGKHTIMHELEKHRRPGQLSPTKRSLPTHKSLVTKTPLPALRLEAPLRRQMASALEILEEGGDARAQANIATLMPPSMIEHAPKDITALLTRHMPEYNCAEGAGRLIAPSENSALLSCQSSEHGTSHPISIVESCELECFTPARLSLELNDAPASQKPPIEERNIVSNTHVVDKSLSEVSEYASAVVEPLDTQIHGKPPRDELLGEELLSEKRHNNIESGDSLSVTKRMDLFTALPAPKECRIMEKQDRNTERAEEESELLMSVEPSKIDPVLESTPAARPPNATPAITCAVYNVVLRREQTVVFKTVKGRVKLYEKKHRWPLLDIRCVVKHTTYLADAQHMEFIRTELPCAAPPPRAPWRPPCHFEFVCVNNSEIPITVDCSSASRGLEKKINRVAARAEVLTDALVPGEPCYELYGSASAMILQIPERETEALLDRLFSTAAGRVQEMVDQTVEDAENATNSVCDTLKTPKIEQRGWLKQQKLQFLKDFPVVDPLEVEVSDFEPEMEYTPILEEENESTMALVDEARLLTGMK